MPTPGELGIIVELPEQQGNNGMHPYEEMMEQQTGKRRVERLAASADRYIQAAGGDLAAAYREADLDTWTSRMMSTSMLAGSFEEDVAALIKERIQASQKSSD